MNKNKINLVRIYLGFCQEKSYDYKKPCDEKQHNEWVKYRNERYPKDKWIYQKKDSLNYNTILKRV